MSSEPTASNEATADDARRRTHLLSALPWLGTSRRSGPELTSIDGLVARGRITSIPGVNGPLLLVVHVLAYSVYPVVVAVLPVRFRLTLLYAHFAAVLAFGGLLGQVYAIELIDGVFVSGGTIAYGALLFTGLVIVLLGREGNVIRSLIGVVVVVNAFVILVFWLVSESLGNAAVVNGLEVPRSLFEQSIPLVVTGGILIVAEVLLLISGFSRVLRAELPRPLEVSLFVAMFVIVLTADGFLFPLLSYPFEPILMEFVRPAMWRNFLLGLAFSAPLIVLVVAFRKRVEAFARQPPILRELLVRTPSELVDELVRQRQDLDQLDIAHQSVSAELQVSTQREREMADRLQGTLELLGDGFMLLDSERRITFFNSGAERLLRRQRDAVVGTSVRDTFPIVSDHPIADQAITALASGESATIEVFAEELELWLEIRAHPIADGLAVFIRDNTEPRKLERQLQRAQRLESVGQLTGGIAHDFNNLLQVVMGSAEMVVPMLADRPAEQGLVELGQQAAQRGADLTKRLLAFSRRQPLRAEVVDVASLVDGMTGLLRHTLDASIDVTAAQAADLWPVVIDAAQFEAGVLNLALNARDAMPSGGQLRIESSNVSIDEPLGAFEQGRYVAVTVTDTGTGMSEDTLGKIFDPFFSTKEAGKGTGLGLSMVYGFLQQSGGGIDVTSEVGVGTAFTMYLPTAGQSDDVTTTASKREHDTVGGTEHILLVEDDELVRVQTYAMLVSLGYRVTAVGDAQQAVAVLEGSEAIDLLFIDIVLPGGTNGHQLADLARELHPGLPVVRVSGFDTTFGGLAAGVTGAVDEVASTQPSVDLRKPYRSEDLALAIRAAFDR